MTDANVSAQNIISESSNKYIGKIMCDILHVVDLEPEYWSFVLVNAVS